MKRSEINKIIEDSLKFAEKYSFSLPPFMTFSPAEWQEKSNDYQEVQDNMLGWDITDFGSNDFYNTGLVMLVLRNGNLDKQDLYPKTYAEKHLISYDKQYTPIHFHWSKMEDIINRGGGDLILQLWNSDKNEQRVDTPVTVSIDGRSNTVKAGERICLKPGESITLEPLMYHCFWAENGKTLIGEVSSVNTDTGDNRFLEEQPRFPQIVEDEPPRHLLITEY